MKDAPEKCLCRDAAAPQTAARADRTPAINQSINQIGCTADINALYQCFQLKLTQTQRFTACPIPIPTR